MADNTTLPGTGEVYRAVDRGGAKEQVVLTAMHDSPSIDAFGRARISDPVTLFDSKLLAADDQPLLWDEALESGAGITASTPTAAKPYIDFTSTLNTAGVFTRQTYRRFFYQPGKSMLLLMTGVLDLSGGGTGVERRIGYFDDDNGLFFEDNAGTIGVTVRSNDSGTPTDTTVTQANWNLDTLDGGADSGNPSGVTADWTKSQIFVIDFQWLGVGRVRFGIEVNGALIYVHEVSQANSAAIPYMSTSNLPLRYQMVTTASSPVSTMRCICSAAISEGGSDVGSGVSNSEGTTAHVNANVADTFYALVGLRLKAAQVGCTVDYRFLSVLAETNDAFEWQIRRNATVAGTFTFADKANSCLQTVLGDTANPSTNTVTGGRIIARGFGATSAAVAPSIEANSQLGVAIDGTLDEDVLCVRALGNNSDIQGCITWRERL